MPFLKHLVYRAFLTIAARNELALAMDWLAHSFISSFLVFATHVLSPVGIDAIVYAKFAAS